MFSLDKMWIVTLLTIILIHLPAENLSIGSVFLKGSEVV